MLTTSLRESLRFFFRQTWPLTFGETVYFTFCLVSGDKTMALFLKALHTKKEQTILIITVALHLLLVSFKGEKSSLKLVTWMRGKYSHNAPPIKGRKHVRLLEKCNIAAAGIVIAWFIVGVGSFSNLQFMINPKKWKIMWNDYFHTNLHDFFVLNYANAYNFSWGASELQKMMSAASICVCVCLSVCLCVPG